jgi:hypothetical protein
MITRILNRWTSFLWLILPLVLICGCDGMITSASHSAGEKEPKTARQDDSSRPGEEANSAAAMLNVLKANEAGVAQLTGDARLVADRVIELDGAERLIPPPSLFAVKPPKVPAGRFHGMQVNDGRLEQIHLTFTTLSDDDLLLFSKVTSLKELSLSGSLKITDAGVEHLAALTNLEKLKVDYTYVSNEAIERLRKILPNCLFLHAPIPSDERR